MIKIQINSASFDSRLINLRLIIRYLIPKDREKTLANSQVIDMGAVV